MTIISWSGGDLKGWPFHDVFSNKKLTDVSYKSVLFTTCFEKIGQCYSVFNIVLMTYLA